MMKYYSNVPKVKHILIDKKLTIKKLSVEIGFNHSYLISLLNGNRHVPKRTAQLIANALNVKVKDIFEIKEEEVTN